MRPTQLPTRSSAGTLTSRQRSTEQSHRCARQVDVWLIRKDAGTRHAPREWYQPCRAAYLLILKMLWPKSFVPHAPDRIQTTVVIPSRRALVHRARIRVYSPVIAPVAPLVWRGTCAVQALRYAVHQVPSRCNPPACPCAPFGTAARCINNGDHPICNADRAGFGTPVIAAGSDGHWQKSSLGHWPYLLLRLATVQAVLESAA